MTAPWLKKERKNISIRTVDCVASSGERRERRKEERRGGRGELRLGEESRTEKEKRTEENRGKRSEEKW